MGDTHFCVLSLFYINMIKNFKTNKLFWRDVCVWGFWIPNTLSIHMEWHLSLSNSKFLNFFLFCSKTLVYQKNNRWNDSKLKDYLIDMGKRRFVELLIRDQKNNLKMYISKIEIIGMIFEIEKPNEDSFQI